MDSICLFLKNKPVLLRNHGFPRTPPFPKAITGVPQAELRQNSKIFFGSENKCSRIL
jgi:hypothetical protein